MNEDSWSLIDSAPKDRFILAFIPYLGPTVLYWSKGSCFYPSISFEKQFPSGWKSAHNTKFYEPTHWQELPVKAPNGYNYPLGIGLCTNLRAINALGCRPSCNCVDKET
jgi:hypothetical protein